MESSPATVTPAPAAMSEAPATTRPRDPGLFGSFDLPAAWGCRRPMAFCRDLDALGGSEPHAAAAVAAVAVEPTRNAARSPPRGAGFQHGPLAAAAAAGAAQEAPRKHWNLRDRKGGRDGGDDAQQNKMLWNMDGADGGGRAGRGFTVELTRQEIDADFYAITGRKAPRKPAKRPRNVQRKIDTICPGNSLWEVSRDRYKVNEKGGF
ncbi:uncharacterized protein LOC102721452 [Oryza brachyantha]|uniref:uncharacterized protein LOC102721452 n=1 Tax=Oryza brachyantha TaxID=4533 RepID=UPI001ADA244B|nr:uncharacterized protein LOC102721452 [Oryza brachyantha]